MCIRDRVDKLIDGLGPSLRNGRYSLYSTNFDPICAAEITEGIVCRDEDPLLFGNGLNYHEGIGVKVVEFLLIILALLLVLFGVF